MNSTIFNCKIFTDQKNYVNIQLIYHSNEYCPLLTIFKQHRIPINYQCQSGYCGICRVFLISGKIKYYTEPLSYIHNNEIFVCCCYPIEDIILKL